MTVKSKFKCQTQAKVVKRTIKFLACNLHQTISKTIIVTAPDRVIKAVSNAAINVRKKTHLQPRYKTIIINE